MARFDWSVDWAGIRNQFQGLQGRHPGLWPVVPRAALLASAVAVIGAVAWFGYWSGQLDELDRRVAEEQKLKTAFVDKTRQVVNLAELRRQKEQVGKYVNALEKQLPSRAEMDALLSEINQAGVGRGIRFELFKPGREIVRDYYAEVPIAIRMVGNYHAFGAFTSEISNLARIVTLGDVQVTRPVAGRNAAPPTASENLTLEATVRTYRYLDQEEVLQRQREARAASVRNDRAKKK